MERSRSWNEPFNTSHAKPFVLSPSAPFVLSKVEGRTSLRTGLSKHECASSPFDRLRVNGAICMSRAFNRGGVLILTLWLVSFLGVLVVILGGQILAAGRVADAYALRVQQLAALETFRARFECALEEDETQTYDALTDPWSRNEKLFQPVRVGSGTATLGEGPGCGVLDEERFISLNRADTVLLERLFTKIGNCDETQAALLAGAVQDWRDLDSISTSPVADTESHPSTPSKNELFESVEELTLIAGMTPGLFGLIRPLVTAYGEGKVNINTAPPDVLRVLGAPDSLVDKLAAFRAGEDGIAGTPDDGFFEEVGTIQAKLESRDGLEIEEINALNEMKSRQWIGVRSEFFRLPVQWSVGGRSWRKSLVVDRKGTLWETAR